MTIALDAVTNGVNGGFTHTPVGTPSGVLVTIRMLNAGDNVSGVTYGGVACTETDDSPLLASGAEGGSLHAFFLGSSVPTGAQTCDVTTTTGTARVTCYTFTAAADTVVQDTNTINETGVTGDRTATLSLGGKTCFVAEAGWCSADSVASITPLASWTVRNERDDGAEVNFAYSYDTIGSSDVTFGATVTGTEDFACLGVAVTESSGGNVSVTPASVDGASSVVAPTVVLGSVTISPVVSAAGAVVNPTVMAGGDTTVAPAQVDAAGAVVAPGVLAGSLSLSPAAVSGAGTVVAPTVRLGSVSVTPAQASASGIVVPPTVATSGGQIVAPSSADGVGDTVAPTVVVGIGWKFDSEVPLSGFWTPETPHSLSPWI